MSDWDDDESEDLLDALENAEEEDLDEDELAELEEFVEEIFELSDEDFEGPVVHMTITVGNDEYNVIIPGSMVSDIIDLASDMDIDLEIDSL